MAVIVCVPNISEGRRPEVISRIAGAVGATPGVRLLDVSSDAAHNRSVLTLAGDAGALHEAVLTLVARALPEIDLRRHHGVHPRLGAVDVVPFVPMRGASMAECVALARRTAEAVAARFALPVYLYEEAATMPGRRNLADIRRGGFEGLGAKMRSGGWAPDFGPPAPHETAGAVVIGARGPLVAYNVNLATDRLEVARAVARTVRHSSGGLPFVKAMGVALADRGIVQVSMNLTNVEQTPMHRVFDLVRREAARHGVAVLESEIVGLVPQAALLAVAADYLALARFDSSRVLENRLADG